MPDFDFLARAWPFGFVHKETATFFVQSLVAKVKGIKDNDSRAASMRSRALLARFGFYEQMTKAERKAQGNPPHQIQNWLPNFKRIFTSEPSKRIEYIVQGAVSQIERVFELVSTCCLETQASRNVPEQGPVPQETREAELDTPPSRNPTSPQPADISADNAPPSTSSTQSQVALDPKTRTTPSASTHRPFHSGMVELASDKFTTCVAERPWQEKVNCKLLLILEQVTLPSDVDYTVNIRAVPSEALPTNDKISTQENPHSLDEDPEGIDGNLSEDKCGGVSPGNHD